VCELHQLIKSAYSQISSLLALFIYQCKSRQQYVQEVFNEGNKIPSCTIFSNYSQLSYMLWYNLQCAVATIFLHYSSIHFKLSPQVLCSPSIQLHIWLVQQILASYDSTLKILMRLAFSCIVTHSPNDQKWNTSILLAVDCMCVCMHVCVSVCVCVHVHACLCACVHAYLCVCVHVICTSVKFQQFYAVSTVVRSLLFSIIFLVYFKARYKLSYKSQGDSDTQICTIYTKKCLLAIYMQ